MIHDTDDIPDLVARGLALTARDRSAVARRLAEIGELPAPSRTETVDYLADTLLGALRYIPAHPVAWSWGEFHNGGGEALEEIGRRQDWWRLVTCAVDLELDGQYATVSPGEMLTPRDALTRNLRRATERMMLAVQRHLEAAGLSPYGHPGLPRLRREDAPPP